VVAGGVWRTLFVAEIMVLNTFRTVSLGDGSDRDFTSEPHNSGVARRCYSANSAPLNALERVAPNYSRPAAMVHHSTICLEDPP